MHCLHRYGLPVPGTSLKTDSYLKCGLVDYNLCRVIVGMPDWNGPNTDKRCIESSYTNVMDVLVPSFGNRGIGSKDSFLCND